MSIHVNVSLYGSLSRLGGGRHVAQLDIKLENRAKVQDLLTQLAVPEQERGYLFVNAVLYGVPGLPVGGEERLHDGDHVGIFSVDRVWPYQYRDGVRMSESLKKALGEHGAMHHTYRNAESQET
jgi:hypothetical protein